MDLQTAVALSILPEAWSWKVARCWRDLDAGAAAADHPGSLLERVIDALRIPCAADALRRQADDVLRRTVELSSDAIPFGDPRFPAALAQIPDPPFVLWLRGDAAALGGISVAVVGSRAASTYALEVAARLAEDLAAHGVTVVSGLARGVDSAAHRGALSAGGRTVAVLGSGIDIIYPAEHTELVRALSAAGAAITELRPGTPPRRRHFPRRNRIISGLCQVVVVVEASEKSGSLITARCALEQGRDVMAVPGSILTGRNRGAHALLKDGAKVVERADDILEELGISAGPPSADAEEVAGLLGALAPGEECDLDRLVAASGVHAEALLPALLELELRGELTRTSGGRFVRPLRKW